LPKKSSFTVVKVDQSSAVVAFSGFSDQDPKYTNKVRDLLVSQVEQLNGEVRSDTFDSKITHVVTPPKCRTMKVMMQAISSDGVGKDPCSCSYSQMACPSTNSSYLLISRLVVPEWVEDSATEGKFLAPDK
jgi:hypothetical protein